MLVRIKIAFKGTAIDVFHGDIGDSLLFAIIVDGNDIRVIDPPRYLRFPFETSDDGTTAVFLT